jgi:hypothetical protein
MITALLLAASFSSLPIASPQLLARSFAPESSDAPESADSHEAPAPTLAPADAREAGYREALDRVRAAIDMANEDPTLGATQLRDALSLLQGFAIQLGQDPSGQKLRTTAQLTLARALLASNDAEGSREAMDEAIRTSRGDPLPTKSFGPGLSALHREREGALGKRGTGSLDIDCHVPCRVYINERPTQPRASGLVPGDYRVWVEASDGGTPRLEQLVAIEADEAARLEFGRAPEPLDPDPPPTDSLGPSGSKPRLLPRWADVLITSAGLVAVGTGAALWAIDGRCPGGEDPADTVACPQVYVTKTAGILSVAVGGAALVSGSVLLSVDEVRTARGRANTMSLVWSMRF